MKKFISLLLVCLMVVPFGMLAGVGVTADDSKVVYLSDAGDDANDGLSAQTAFKSLETAYAALGNDGGEIVIVGTFTQSANFLAEKHTGTVTIKGADSTATYKMGAGCRYFLGGPTVFDNFTLDATAFFIMIVCLYNDFTATENFVINRNKDTIIVAGGQSDTSYAKARDFGVAKDVTITLNGGNWQEVIGSMRQGWRCPTPEGVSNKTAEDFKDHKVTFNIGGNVTIAKFFAASRSATGQDMIFPNSSCTINLNGGKITLFLAHMDQMNRVTGYENGVTINVAKTFNLAESFEGGANVDPDTRLASGDANKVFYGLSPLFAYADEKIVATASEAAAAIKNTLVVDNEIYDAFIADKKIRVDDFDVVKPANDDSVTTAPDAVTTAPDAVTTAPDAVTTAPDAVTTAPDAVTTAPDAADPAPAKTIYLSDNGNDANDGSSADKSVKTLTRAYELIGNEGGEIIVVDTFTISANFFGCDKAHAKKITIKGADANAAIKVAANVRFFLGGETEFTNIKIEAVDKSTFYIICNFNSLTVSDTVTVKRAADFIINLGTQGGKGTNDRAYTVSDATLTINGGDWQDVVLVARTGFTKKDGTTATADEFKGLDVTLNVGGNAKIAKVYAFTRNNATQGDYLVDGSATVNLNGGTITHFLCQTDNKSYVNGFSRGMTVNIGKGFDIDKSFTAGTQTDGHWVVDSSKAKIFYGISGESAWEDSAVKANKIGKSKIVIDGEIYDSIKSNGALRTTSVQSVSKAGDAPAGSPNTGYATWVVAVVAAVAVMGCATIVVSKKKEN